MDMGSHMFNLVIGLAGAPWKVFARTATRLHRYDVEDSAEIVAELADGTPVVAGFLWNSKTWAHEMEIIGSEARLQWMPLDGACVRIVRGANVEEVELPNAGNVHAPLVAQFAAVIRTGAAAESTLADAALTNKVLDAIYESAATRREVVL
jgi:predicted dehydrogenase